ncbi:MAG: hypothetical protein K9K76_07590 [Halanaerobiales bacterium]|nr:hypothetical protein [Halanaerobiales bacterium]
MDEYNIDRNGLESIFLTLHGADGGQMIKDVDIFVPVAALLNPKIFDNTKHLKEGTS